MHTKSPVPALSTHRYIHTNLCLHTHTHMAMLSLSPPSLPPPPFVLCTCLSVQTRRQDVFFLVEQEQFAVLWWNPHCSDRPKIKVWAYQILCVCVLLTLIRPINSLSVTKSVLAARQTQLPVKSVLLLLGLPGLCFDVCHSSNQHQDMPRLF